jgi:hypothetical protein
MDKLKYKNLRSLSPGKEKRLVDKLKVKKVKKYKTNANKIKIKNIHDKYNEEDILVTSRESNTKLLKYPLHYIYHEYFLF